MIKYEQLAYQILEEAIDIQQIAAPTFFEKKRSEYVYKRFLEEGFHQVSKDDLYNVYARIPGGSQRPVVISAHLDTVFDQITDLTIQQGKARIYGPGIGDNSLAVATLVGFKEILDTFPQKPSGDIILVANSCEEGEGNLAGIKEVVKTLVPENPKAYIVLEGMGLDRIYVQGVGSKRYKITATAKGGHSWSDFGQGSAVHALLRLGATLTNLKMPETPKATFNIGVIQGGRSVNTIADNAYMLLDLRAFCTQTLTQLVDEVETLINSFSMDQIKVSYEIIGSRSAGEISKESDLVRLCQAAHKIHGFTDPKLKAGSTDANIPFSMNIPAICLGLTEGGDAHLESEYIETKPFVKGLSILSHILQRIWEIK